MGKSPQCILIAHHTRLEKVFLYDITDVITLDQLFIWYTLKSKTMLWVKNTFEGM